MADPLLPADAPDRQRLRLRTRRTSRGLIAALSLAAVLAACSSDGPDEAATSTTAATARTGRGSSSATATTKPADQGGATFPGAMWDTAEPAEEGFDPAALDALAAEAEAAGSQCLVVVRDGVVVADRSWPGPTTSPREVFSATKSLSSILVGIAQDRGDLSIDDKASTYIPEWKGTPSDVVTIEDLLSNTSGRQWDLATDYASMAIRAEDKTAFSIGLGQQHPPGEVWAYNNSAIQTLSAVVKAATGQTASELAKSAVFDPIGMADSSLATDAAGNSLMFMGLRTTCLDLARFGHLMLHEGNWDGEQVVSKDYVDAATRRASSELNVGYGYLWWRNERGHIATPTLATTGKGDGTPEEGQLLPGASENIFWALGLNDQVVAVIPDDEIVAVRVGPKPPDDAPFGQRELTSGVLAALNP